MNLAHFCTVLLKYNVKEIVREGIRDGQGSGWTVGGIILEIFTVGGVKKF